MILYTLAGNSSKSLASNAHVLPGVEILKLFFLNLLSGLETEEWSNCSQFELFYEDEAIVKLYLRRYLCIQGTWYLGISDLEQ